MPESTPKITVVIPAYNIETLLEKCVGSVAKQDYPKDKLEIIVVDDGSTDSTGALCDELASKYENVTALHKENGGSSSARNLGLKHASGDYIGFVDSDDYVDPRMYRELAEAAVKYDADMVQISRDEMQITRDFLKYTVKYTGNKGDNCGNNICLKLHKSSSDSFL